jgi:murein DD-endopeptidase MepM/ murein hydrolase activator NlpD
MRRGRRDHIAPWKRAAALAVLAVSGAVAAVASIVPATDAELLVSKAAVLEPVTIRLDEALLPSPSSYVRQERFQRGDTLSGLIARLAIAAPDAQRLLGQRELRLLRPGTTVTAEVRDDGTLVWLAFLSARTNEVRIERVGDKLAASQRHAAIETRSELKSSEIRSSLFGAADAAGIPDSVAIQLADVFGSDIDFYRDLRTGDRFSVLYEMQWLDGRPLRAGRVLAAEFVNQGRTLRAVAFGDGYYAPDGHNMRKALLRSPLEFSRVSSGFGMRKHPFLHSWRAHQGVDYAAPAGTRVRAVGDGVVQFAGRQGGYGNIVILRHDAIRTTVYGHLRAFGQGIRSGARVSQGDTVGLVGQTGWATGPHLHFEFRVSGTARNPLSVPLPEGRPVARHDMDSFRALSLARMAQIDLIAASHATARQVAALE